MSSVPLLLSLLILNFLSWNAHLAFAAAAASETTEVVLQVGESLKLAAGVPIRLEKSTAVKLLNGRIPTLVAVRPGATSFEQGGRRREVSVLNAARMKTLRSLRAWAAVRPGLEVLTRRGEVVLTGELLQVADWTGLADSCAGCEYRSELQFPPGMQTPLDNSFSALTKRQGLALPPLRMNPAAEWSVPKGQRSPALVALASRLGIEVLEESDALQMNPMIKTQIFVMEVRRKFSRQWGIQWPESASAQLVPGGRLLGGALGFSAHALEEEGVGKILASPTLLCRSGEEAEFLAGGEFPIKVANFHAQGVVWKRYGIVLKVKPRADRHGRLSMTLETEVSTLDGANKVDGIPGLLTNRVLSHFDLEKTTVIALSGLIKNEESRSAAGLPGLSRVPILGGLFGSQDFQENRSELIIFVKPEVVELGQLEARHDR